MIVRPERQESDDALCHMAMGGIQGFIEGVGSEVIQSSYKLRCLFGAAA